MLKHRSLILCFVFIAAIFSNSLFAQDKKVKWQRHEAKKLDLQLLHSTFVINLPTAETLQKGDFLFEISHRFIPTTGSGHNGLYGFDGPVNMRIALGYALTNRWVVTLGRSNFNDNIDLWTKLKILQIRMDVMPILVSAKFGGAWNTQMPPEIYDRDKTNKRNFQGFGQLVINTLIAKKLGLGLVPSYVYNSDIRFSDKTKDTFTLGNYMQYYVSHMFSLMIEWNPKISGYLNKYNALSFGFELETGGHFFKVFLTNNYALNTAQFLSGSDLPVDNNDWRLGFGITRLLKFGHKM